MHDVTKNDCDFPMFCLAASISQTETQVHPLAGDGGDHVGSGAGRLLQCLQEPGLPWKQSNHR